VISCPQVSPPKHCIHLSSSPYVLHAPLISFFSYDHLNNIWWGAKIIKLHIMQFSPLSCYPVPLRPKYSPQHYTHHTSNRHRFITWIIFGEEYRTWSWSSDIKYPHQLSITAVINPLPLHLNSLSGRRQSSSTQIPSSSSWRAAWNVHILNEGITMCLKFKRYTSAQSILVLSKTTCFDYKLVIFMPLQHLL